MKLKTIYSLSTVGLLLTGFGGGWIALSQILNLPMTFLTIIGVVSASVGMGIMISALSTIKKIDLIVEEEI